jgi:ParB family chromosome partitioning protein
MGHARALLGLGDDAERVRLAGSVVERNLSVRATENLIRRTLEGKGRAPPATPPELSVVSEVLRTPELRVQLQQRSAGTGKLIVEFADTDSRDTIIAAIKAAVSS